MMRTTWVMLWAMVWGLTASGQVPAGSPSVGQEAPKKQKKEKKARAPKGKQPVCPNPCPPAAEVLDAIDTARAPLQKAAFDANTAATALSKASSDVAAPIQDLKTATSGFTTANAELKKTLDRLEETIRENKKLLKPAEPGPAKVPYNGISIGAPKSFDNRSLTLMIESLSETLRGMNLIDPKAVSAAFGLYQGSQTTEVNRSLTLVTPPVPGRTITDKPLATNPTEARDVTTTTTVAARDPIVPVAPESLTGPADFKPSFGTSPGDLLGDQVNVMYQIFNLRMLQERALSDRIHDRAPRLQTVLGFNVSLDPPRTAENAAAIVEVEVSLDGEKKGPLSLVAMMPQEKTYNRTALSNKANTFGASAVARLFTVGYTERRRGQIFYVFRDHDTVSFEKMRSSADDVAHFGWQFRPVLGKRSVMPGMRQLFAVLSLPVKDEGDQEYKLKVVVRTRWMKYYPKALTTAGHDGVLWPSHVAQGLTLAAANTIPTDLESTVTDYTLPVFTTARYQKALAPEIKEVEWAFTGEKSMNVMVRGKNFYPGTTVVLGDKTFSDAASGMVLKSAEAIDLNGDGASIGTGEGVLVGRYGSAVPLRPKSNHSGEGIKISGVEIRPKLEGIQELSIAIEAKSESPIADVLPRSSAQVILEPVLRLQGKVIPRPYSYEYDERRQRITALVPVAAAEKLSGMLEVIYPYHGPEYRAGYRLYEDPYRVTLLNRKQVTTAKDAASKLKDSAEKEATLQAAVAQDTAASFRSYLIEKLDGFSFRFDSDDPDQSCWFAIVGSRRIQLGQRDRRTTKPEKPWVCDQASTEFQSVSGMAATLQVSDSDKPSSDMLALRNPYGGVDWVKLPKDTPEPAIPKIGEKQETTVDVHDARWIGIVGENLAGVAGVFVGEVKLDLRVADKEGKKLEFFLPSALTNEAANLDVTYRDATGKYLGRTRVTVQCPKCVIETKKEK
jgi:hypothetical protein